MNIIQYFLDVIQYQQKIIYQLLNFIVTLHTFVQPAHFSL